MHAVRQERQERRRADGQGDALAERRGEHGVGNERHFELCRCAEIVDQQGVAARGIEPRQEAFRHERDQPVGILDPNALDAGFAVNAETELALIRAQPLLVRPTGDRA
jgi:hypothetical protein